MCLCMIIVRWFFQKGRFFIFLDIVTWQFYFLVGLYKKCNNLFCRVFFSQNFFINQLATVMLQVMDSFFSNYSKNRLFVYANMDGKHILSKKFCIAHQDDKICFLPIFRYHNILIGDIKELLQKPIVLCFNYQLGIAYIHFSSSRSVTIFLSGVDNFLIKCRELFIPTKGTKERKEYPASWKKTCEKQY